MVIVIGPTGNFLEGSHFQKTCTKPFRTWYLLWARRRISEKEVISQKHVQNLLGHVLVMSPTGDFLEQTYDPKTCSKPFRTCFSYEPNGGFPRRKSFTENMS